MGDTFWYYFWIAVTALYATATVYSFVVAAIVRKELAASLTWIFFGLAVSAGSKVFIRSGQQLLATEEIIVMMRAVELMVAITACAAAVQLGFSYNYKTGARPSWREQLDMLKQAFSKETNGEIET